MSRPFVLRADLSCSCLAILSGGVKRKLIQDDQGTSQPCLPVRVSAFVLPSRSDKSLLTMRQGLLPPFLSKHCRGLALDPTEALGNPGVPVSQEASKRATACASNHGAGSSLALLLQKGMG